MKRFLFISVENIHGGTYYHFDIIPGINWTQASKILKNGRKEIESFNSLDLDEIDSIHNAMLFKTDEELLLRFTQKTKEYPS